jgi:hypothetical protein
MIVAWNLRIDLHRRSSFRVVKAVLVVC